MLVVVVVLLFLVLVQGLTKVSDQSRALEDRNDSNNSLEGTGKPLDISALSGRLLTANIHCPHTK